MPESTYSLALLYTFHMSTERDDSIQDQCLLRKSRCGANTICSTFVCQFMWWLKFKHKHVTLLISCQFNRTVSLAASGCFHVHFPTEQLRLICLLADIKEHDEFSKKYRWFFHIFNSSNEWTFCSGRKFLQVDRGFLYFQNKILLFMFFHFFKKSYIQYM